MKRAHSYCSAEWSASLQPLRQALSTHRLYGLIASVDDVRIFTEHHIFAVWDFMSLLKALQQSLTCVSLPWLPQGDPLARRFVNAIVLGEESDEDGFGGYLSHFEMYLKAMEETGSDIGPITRFCEAIRSGCSAPQALRRSGAPRPIEPFVQTTWTIIESGEPHQIAAAFTLGREEIIPEMFVRIVDELNCQLPGRFGRFRAYLERHIGVDRDDHGPMALRILDRLCDDHAKRRTAQEVASSALAARMALWEAIANQLEAGKCASGKTADKVLMRR